MIHVTYVDNFKEVNQEIFNSLSGLELHPQDEDEGYLIYSNVLFGKKQNPEVEIKNVIVQKNLKLLENEIYSVVGPDLKIAHSWLLQTDPGGYAGIHTHGDFYSGVYYVRAEKGQGVLRFKFFEIEEHLDIEPRTGNLIIFGPEPLPHEILKNDSDSSRISIAFILEKQ